MLFNNGILGNLKKQSLKNCGEMGFFELKMDNFEAKK